MKPGTNQHGIPCYNFVLDPTDELIKRYNLKVNPQGDMLYTQQLPCDLVICLNPDPAWTRWLFLGTYNGEPHLEIEKLAGTKQQKEMIKLRQVNQRLMMKLDVAEEKLHLMEINMPKYLERNFKPLQDLMLPLIEKVVKKSGD